ncbi:hypothetical protein JCM11491_006836 [Sporobolomyces phaffii]
MSYSPAHPVSEHVSAQPSYSVGSSNSTATSLSPDSVGPHPLDPSRGRYFLDSYGRRILLHGVNVSGLNKLPSEPNGETHLDLGAKWYDGESISFVGRPWPLDESHTHLSRLRQWGFTFIRFVVPWEALEHAGPGQYDEEYFAYLHELISSFLPRYGMKCYIDAHQDVWSRHTGGSGAPTWTLQLVGLDIRALKSTGAAQAHNLHLDPDKDSLAPAKNWPAGMCKLAAATMATVFWGGDIFAWKRRVQRRLHRGEWGQSRNSDDELVSLQTFLQTSMIEAFGRLADRLKDCEAVLGFEVINEPHRGYISLHSPHAWDLTADLAIGCFPSALQSWALGTGRTVDIPHYTPAFPVTAVSHTIRLSPPGKRSAWLLPLSDPAYSPPSPSDSIRDLRSDSSGCIWEEHGVWKFDEGKQEPVVLKQEYFRRFAKDQGSKRRGELVDWEKDCYFPFVQRFSRRVTRKANPSHWITFVEPIPNELAFSWAAEERPRNLVFAPHWYDLQALFGKRLGWMSANVQGLAKGMFLLKALYFGRSGLRKNYSVQISNILQASYQRIGECPVVLGETGCPFDLNGGPAAIEARKGGEWRGSDQERMVDAILGAIGEAGLSNYNFWNYNPLNTDEWGDSWNGENFSWYSTSGVTEERLEAAGKHAAERGEDEVMAMLNVGARILDAIERPYSVKTAGIPMRAKFDFHTLNFSFAYINPIPPASPLAAAMPPSDCSPHSPPIVGVECRARETEVYLPSRRYAKLFRRGLVKVKLRTGDGTWRWNEELQTLYVLHENCTPGFVHTIDVSISGLAAGESPDRPPLHAWYEPRLPGFLASFNFDFAAGDWVWLWALVIAVVGVRMGFWLVVGDGFWKAGDVSSEIAEVL